MGRGFVSYRLANGQEEWVLWSAYINYRLADHTTLDILQQAAWCSRSDRFVIAEEVPTVEALLDEQNKLLAGDPDALALQSFLRQTVPKRLAELDRSLAWRSLRQSLPRCLECGQPNPVPIPTAGEFAHPSTGKRVVVTGNGFADTARWVAMFDPDGRLLRNGSD